MSRLIYGMQPVREAIRAHGADLRKVLVLAEGGPRVAALGRFARDQGIAVEEVSRGELDRLTRNGMHQGAAAFAEEVRLTSLSALSVGPETAILVLDGIMDPQNFGAAIRSAVALGASAVLWPEHASAPLSPAAFRASAGAVEHATLCRVPALPTALQDLRARGVRTVALDVRGPVLLAEVDLKGPVALIIGAEDRGPRRPLLAACDAVARLPIAGPVAALNASVSAALALYEVRRQRQA